MRIDRELTLLRTALLYADEVQLLSPVTEMISRVQKFHGLSRREFLARIGRMNLTEAQDWGIATTSSEEWEALSIGTAARIGDI